MAFGKRFKTKDEVAETPVEIISGIIGKEIEKNQIKIILSGKIDAMNYESIQTEVMELIDNATDLREFIFDMSAVNYVSSAGLRMFSAINKAVSGHNAHYMLIEMRRDIYKMFQMTGYASAFSIKVKDE